MGRLKYINHIKGIAEALQAQTVSLRGQWSQIRQLHPLSSGGSWDLAPRKNFWRDEESFSPLFNQSLEGT